MSVPTLFQNYVSDVAVTMVFGLGYYLFKSFKKPRKSSKLQNKSNSFQQISLEIFKDCNTLEEINIAIENDKNRLNPYLILEVMTHKNIPPNLETYNLLLKKAYDDNNSEACKSIFDEMIDVSGPVNPNIHTFNIIINGLRNDVLKKIESNEIIDNNNEKTDSLKELNLKEFQEHISNLESIMKSRNLYFEISSLNIIFETCLDLGNFDEGLNSLIKYKLKGDNQTSEMISNFIKNTKNTIKLAELNKIQQIFISNKFDNEDLLQLIFEEYLRLKKIEKCEYILSSLESNNQHIFKTDSCFLLLLRIFGKQLKFEKCMDLFRKIRKFGLVPSIEAIDIMLNTCIKCRKLEKAEEILDEVQENKDLFYEKLINGFKLSKNYERAINFFQKIGKENLKDITLHSLNNILECCVETTQISKMHEIYNSFKFKIYVNQITYSILLKGYCREKLLEEVKRVYNLVRRNHYILDEIIYKMCLDLFCELEEEGYLTTIISDMRRYSIPINLDTYARIIKKFYSKKSYFGIEIYDELLKSGVKPDQKIYHYIIMLYLNFGYLDKAINCFRKMQTLNCFIHRDLLDLLIKKSIEKKRDKESFEFTLNALKMNYKYGEELYSTLVCNLIKNEKIKVQERFDLINRLNKEIKYRGIRLNQDAFDKSENFINKFKVVKQTLYTAGSLYNESNTNTNTFNENIPELEKIVPEKFQQTFAGVDSVKISRRTFENSTNENYFTQENFVKNSRNSNFEKKYYNNETSYYKGKNYYSTGYY